MRNDLVLPADDAERAILLDKAVALAERCRSPVTDAALDAAMRTVLTRHHCAPVFPGLGALVDALNGSPRPSPDDADEEEDDDATRAVHRLRQGKAR